MPKAHILVAEDSKVQRKLLEQELAAFFDVTYASSGDEAVEELKRKPYDVMVLDWILPNLSGLEILKFIREKKIEIKTVVTTSQSRHAIEAEALRAGMDYLMPKPLDPEALVLLLQKWTLGEGSLHGAEPLQEVEPTLIKGKLYPFQTLNRRCFICGYEPVKLYKPIPGTYEELWPSGLFPEYVSNEGFEPWDFLKTYITVCPFCFFASSKYEDFADDEETRFPYHQDAKRILSRTISSRRKLLSEVKEVDKRFENPNRSGELVVDSLKLAEKCVNGLILGGKEGSYAQIGFYQLLLGGLNYKTRQSYYQRSLENFKNQLNQPHVSEEVVLTSSYCILALEMTLHSSEKAKGYWNWIQDRYDQGIDHLSDMEKVWCQRIQDLWDKGVRREEIRFID